MYYDSTTYFKTPQGRKLREQFFSDPRHKKCKICGKTDNLIAHHLTYEHLGQELEYHDLVALCNKSTSRRKSCHERVHFPMRGGKTAYNKEIMQARITFLRRTNSIRNFKFGSFINAVVSYLISAYKI